MSVIFNSKDSVFFVGGTGTKAGRTDAGGCTQAWLDAKGSGFQLSDIMGANGAAIDVIGDDGVYTFADERVTKAGEFTHTEIGMVVYFLDQAGGTPSGVATGRYEVTDVDTVNGNWIELDGTDGTGDSNDVKIVVGGAFDKLQNVIDAVDASHGYNVKIYTNKTEVATQTIDFDSVGGSVANNSQVIVEGFNTLLGDMNYGGNFYQGPLDCLINGIDTDKCIMLNRQGEARDVITINNFDGLVLKNIYFYNTDKASGHDCIAISNYPRNLGLINCKFDTAYGAIAGTVYGLEMRDCYVGNDFAYTYQFNSFYARGGHVTNCVFDIDGLTYTTIKDHVTFEHCLFWKSTAGVLIYSATIFDNCVFYGQTESCLRLNNVTDASIRGRNNIFMPAEAADFVAYASGATGSVCNEALRRSCVWTIAGEAVTNHISVNSITRQLSDVIEADPQFVDAANGDFRPRNPAVLRGGKPDISGNPTQMGAILQKYQFGDRERIANMARLRIIR